MQDRKYTLLVGERNICVEVPAHWTVRDLKEHLRHGPLREEASRRQTTFGRTLFVAAGRVLQDNTVLEDAVAEGAAIHVALPEPNQRGGSDVESGRSASASAAAPAASAAAASSSTASSASALAAHEAQSLRGFDRLRALGLDDDDIGVLRLQFLPDVERAFRDLPLLPGETETSRLFRMEEAWLRSQSDDSPLALNLRPLLLARGNRWSQSGGDGYAAPLYLGRGHGEEGGGEEEGEGDGRRQPQQGTLGSAMMGVMVGWFLGFLAFLFALSPTSSRRFKQGVALGVGLNLAVTVLLAATSDGAGGSGSGSGSGSGGLGPDPWAFPTGTGTGPLQPVDLATLGGT